MPKNPFETNLNIGKDEPKHLDAERIFETILTELKSTAPSVVEMLSDLSPEERALLDQALNKHGITWYAFGRLDEDQIPELGLAFDSLHKDQRKEEKEKAARTIAEVVE